MSSPVDVVVQEVLLQVRAGDVEGAWCSLTGADPAVVPPLIDACQAEKSREVRRHLLRMLWWQMQSPLTIPLLNEALRDRQDESWKDALDGLVSLASVGAGADESIAVLELVHAEEAAALHPNKDYLVWVSEAIEQAREALAAKTPGAG